MLHTAGPVLEERKHFLPRLLFMALKPDAPYTK
jgi:hypothetical protein